YDSYPFLIGSGFRRLHKLIEHVGRPPSLPAPFSREGAVGSHALVYADGFRLDGSHQNGAYYTKLMKDPEVQDPDYSFTRWRVDHEVLGFEPGDELSPEAIKQLGAMADFLAARKVKLIVFMPPFAPEIYDALARSPRHAVFGKFRAFAERWFRERGVP